ncbi:Hypothetical predicted protein [Paramuricea clavata]|uniref:Uncharacterized protein n=1 Tax=Paramuricea clavata TaxID=317549 RepID=A0A7D9J3I3_PARCT|nr:Hypothetical predicted protein [Paramuricea clavata]
MAKWKLYPVIIKKSVANKLRKLKPNKAPGPSDANVKILKIFTEYFAIPLTNIFNKSFKVTPHDEIMDAQYGGQSGSSAVLVLIYLVHKWHMVLDTPGFVIRILFLDFRKVYDPIDGKLL